MSVPRMVRQLLGALYAWSVAVFLGAVLLDVVYSGLLENANESITRSVYGEVSDFLLLLGAFSVLAALAAIGVSWKVRAARNLFAVSVLVVLASEFLTPLLLSPWLSSSPDSPVVAITPFLRLVPIGVASLLALGALGALFQDSSSAGPR